MLVIFPVLFMQNRMNQLELSVTVSLQFVLKLYPAKSVVSQRGSKIIFFHRRGYYVEIAGETVE